jgi:hypothetical protein
VLDIAVDVELTTHQLKEAILAKVSSVHMQYAQLQNTLVVTSRHCSARLFLVVFSFSFD